jgi:hypothetical protein
LPWKPTVSFIGQQKTSYTAGTLCAIAPKLVKNKNLKKWLDIIKNMVYYEIKPLKEVKNG